MAAPWTIEDQPSGHFKMADRLTESPFSVAHHCSVLAFPLQKFPCWKFCKFALRNKAFAYLLIYFHGRAPSRSRVRRSNATISVTTRKPISPTPLAQQTFFQRSFCVIYFARIRDWYISPISPNLTFFPSTPSLRHKEPTGYEKIERIIFKFYSHD